MSNRIAVVGEAAGDFEVARELIDQTILRCVEYARRENVPVHVRSSFSTKPSQAATAAFTLCSRMRPI